MAARQLGRAVVLQSLYEWDFYNKSADLKDSIERNLEEFAPGFSEKKFVMDLAEGIKDKADELDAIIVKSIISNQRMNVNLCTLLKPCFRSALKCFFVP